MTIHDNKEFAKDLAIEIVKELQREGKEKGRIDPETHEAHHQLIDELIKFLAELRKTRWIVFRTLIIALIFALVGIFGLGVVSKLKTVLGM